MPSEEDSDTWEGEGKGFTEEQTSSHSNEHDAESSPDQENQSDEEDGGDYDPESLPSGLSPVLATRTISHPKPKPKKISGGFLVASSDEEDDEDEPVAAPSSSQEDSGEDQAEAAHPPLQALASASDQDQAEGPPDLVLKPSHTVYTTTDPLPLQADVQPAPVDDSVTAFERRIKEDPRGDMDAWIGLIAEMRRRSNVEDIRKTYNRFVAVFPQAADIWVEWIEYELLHDNFVQAEQLFGRSLMTVPNVQLWTTYLNYIRRRNDLTNDGNGQARRTIAQSYEFVIDNIGIDKQSGKIWQDYVSFIRSGPGTIGGSNWQDQQKMDQLRKAYQRAISVPTPAINGLWKEYDQFETGLNKMTGRKFVQERSPNYMSAKSANIALDNLTRNIDRRNLPRLPPAPGFDGDREYMAQVDLWKKWINWEKEDPLVLKGDEPEVYTQRVLHCYKQALFTLRFWPEMWVEAAEWCFKNKVTKDGKDVGTDFMLQGIAANPESVLLALKHGDRIELTHPDSEDEDLKSARAAAVRQPYDKVLGALYGMIGSIKDRERSEMEKIVGPGDKVAQKKQPKSDNDSDDGLVPSSEGSKEAMSKEAEARIATVSQGFTLQIQQLSRIISFVWIALARAMRRIQGKGSAKAGGLRQVFIEARGRGRLTSDVYVAVALIESTVYKDPVGLKIFERGAKLFPDDEYFMLEYVKFLHSKDDTTNARVIFEQCVGRLTQKPATAHKAKPLYSYFHRYESQYGELSQIVKLEERMEELFPDDPKLVAFSRRFANDKFDPIEARIIISPATQLRPKRAVMSSIEGPGPRDSPMPSHRPASPRPANTSSPKRPFQDDGEEMIRPRKLARGESPLKGAAGRRLDQQRRNQASSLHMDITFLLSVLPPAYTYDAVHFNPTRMVNLLQNTQIPDHATWKAKKEHAIRAAPTAQPSEKGDYQGGYGGYGSHDSAVPQAVNPYEGGAAARRIGHVAGGGAYRNSPLAGSYDTYGGSPAPPVFPAPPAVEGGGGSWPPPPAGFGQPYGQPSASQFGRYPY